MAGELLPASLICAKGIAFAVSLTEKRPSLLGLLMQMAIGWSLAGRAQATATREARMILEALHLAVAHLAGASLDLAPSTRRLRVVIATPVLRRMLRMSSLPSSELAVRKYQADYQAKLVA